MLRFFSACQAGKGRFLIDASVKNTMIWLLAACLAKEELSQWLFFSLTDADTVNALSLCM